jgi:hypothetical protein
MSLNTERSDNLGASLSQISVLINKALAYYYVRLSNYVIPNTWDNIISGYNNQLTLIEDGADVFTVTIPQGAYSITTLSAAIKAALEAGSPSGRTYSVTPNMDTYRLSIAATSGGVIFVGYIPEQSTIGSVIGFTATDNTEAVTISGSRCFNVTANEIYITSNLVKHIKINNGDMRILDKVPVDKNFGYRLTNSNIDSEYVSIDGSSVNLVELNLVFADGTPVPMRNGWSCDLDFIATLQ